MGDNMKYIIDTDPGIDDAIAIMLGYLNKLDIIGFTLATGNIEKEKSKDNLKIIQDILGSNIKMFEGTKENNCNIMSAEYAHGTDGLGNIFMPKSLRKFENNSAEDFIIESANKYKENLTIVCLGPLTNLASALEKDKTLSSKIKNVVIMGSTYDPNNKVPYREFNVKIDPNSAKKVFETNFENIKIITHEVGIKSFIERDYIDTLKNSNNKISKFVYIISQKYMEFSHKHYNTNGLTTPDPTTIASLINENIVIFRPCTIDVIDGLSHVKLTNESNIKISVDFDIKLFRNIFEKTFN